MNGRTKVAFDLDRGETHFDGEIAWAAGISRNQFRIPGSAASSRFPRVGGWGRLIVVLVALLSSVTVSSSAQSPKSHSQRGPATTITCSIPGLTPSSARKLTYQDLLDSYNAQAALIHSMQASAIVHASGGSELNTRLRDSRPLPAEIIFRSPASLRMTGMIPFSSRRSFDLSSDGRDFRLLVPDGNKMRYIFGSVDSPATSANPRENIRPQMILEAIRWLPAKLTGSMAPTSVVKPGSETIEVELRTSTGSVESAQLEFDLHSGILARLSVFDTKGQNTTKVFYSDWQKVSNGEGSATSCFPKRITVEQEQQTRQLELKFLLIQLNVPVLPSKFYLTPPPGVAVTRVGVGGNLESHK